MKIQSTNWSNKENIWASIVKRKYFCSIFVEGPSDLHRFSIALRDICGGPQLIQLPVKGWLLRFVVIENFLDRIVIALSTRLQQLSTVVFSHDSTRLRLSTLHFSTLASQTGNTIQFWICFAIKIFFTAPKWKKFSSTHLYLPTIPAQNDFEYFVDQTRTVVVREESYEWNHCA